MTWDSIKRFFRNNFERNSLSDPNEILAVLAIGVLIYAIAEDSNPYIVGAGVLLAMPFLYYNLRALFSPERGT
jgi:hypothetical protein